MNSNLPINKGLSDFVIYVLNKIRDSGAERFRFSLDMESPPDLAPDKHVGAREDRHLPVIYVFLGKGGDRVVKLLGKPDTGSWYKCNEKGIYERISSLSDQFSMNGTEKTDWQEEMVKAVERMRALVEEESSGDVSQKRGPFMNFSKLEMHYFTSTSNAIELTFHDPNDEQLVKVQWWLKGEKEVESVHVNGELVPRTSYNESLRRPCFSSVRLYPQLRGILDVQRLNGVVREIKEALGEDLETEKASDDRRGVKMTYKEYGDITFYVGDRAVKVSEYMGNQDIVVSFEDAANLFIEAAGIVDKLGKRFGGRTLFNVMARIDLYRQLVFMGTDLPSDAVVTGCGWSLPRVKLPVRIKGSDKMVDIRIMSLSSVVVHTTEKDGGWDPKAWRFDVYIGSIAVGLPGLIRDIKAGADTLPVCLWEKYQSTGPKPEVLHLPMGMSLGLASDLAQSWAGQVSAEDHSEYAADFASCAARGESAAVSALKAEEAAEASAAGGAVEETLPVSLPEDDNDGEGVIGEVYVPEDDNEEDLDDNEEEDLDDNEEEDLEEDSDDDDDDDDEEEEEEEEDDDDDENDEEKEGEFIETGDIDDICSRIIDLGEGFDAEYGEKVKAIIGNASLPAMDKLLEDIPGKNVEMWILVSKFTWLINQSVAFAGQPPSLFRFSCKVEGDEPYIVGEWATSPCPIKITVKSKLRVDEKWHAAISFEGRKWNSRGPLLEVLSDCNKLVDELL